MSANHPRSKSPDIPLRSPPSPSSSLQFRPQYRRQDASPPSSKRQESSTSTSPLSSSTEANDVLLQQLKEAVMSQQRMPVTSAVVAATSLPKAVKRIPSIKEEEPLNPANIPGSMSPSLSASFDSPLPLPSISTGSTESTGSARTIKGSALTTPAASAYAVMTPSYPFPVIPGTPQWESVQRRAFHGSGNYQVVTESNTSHLSEPNTPIPPSAGTFYPVRTASTGPALFEEVSEGPNLYDLVLTLNMDPGLHSWWTGVVKIFTEYFGAERLSLALPADAGEVENVPWGQKATYNKSGFPSVNSALKPKEELDNIKSNLISQPQPKSGLESTRPQITSRHSYSGFDTQRGGLRRPPGPMRMRTYANPRQPESEPAGIPTPLIFPSRTFSLSDSEFSTMPPQPSDAPYSAVLSVLRALNFETDALLEAASVNKLLERAGIVVLTRDYSQEKHAEAESQASSDSGKSNSGIEHKKKPHGEHFVPRIHGAYEEYEQVASSPWAQSPAPSPAIQADPEQNPFFGDSNVDDDAFNPKEEESQNYNSSVEAIGVDHANTIIHIPLVHPRSSSRFMMKNDPNASPELGGRASPPKKLPIAIISLSAPVVPYPAHLIKSLQYLIPHLATSFDIAQQYTNLYTQNEAQFRRNYGPGDRRGTLGDLDETEIDISNDSLTSPSEYSGRSRQSPGGSTGTPGWDSGNFGLSKANVVPVTPGVQSASEMIESYFDAKKRLETPAQGQSVAVTSTNNKGDTGKDIIESDNSQARQSANGKSSTLWNYGPELRMTAGIAARRPHSFLHSYGADFKSTFQTLPVGASPLNPPKLPEDNTGLSHLIEISEMPPPSEKLLRTIIDSLPVQIFTAAPHTGELTWVNSKFIAYRGQPSQYVLRNSWDALHPDDKQVYMDEWKHSLHTGQQFSQKARLLRFDGEYRWFYVRATPLKNKRGQIVHWTGTCMDVHEQHLAEVNAARQKETEASEAKYRSLANSSPQIVFAIEPTRGLTFCNSQWLRYSGQTDEDAAGLGFLDYVHPEDISRCRLPVPRNPDESVESTERIKLSSEESSESGITVTNQSNSPDVGKDPQQRMSELANQGVLKIIRDQDGIPSYSTEVRLRSKDNEYHWHLIRVLKAEGLGPDTWYGTCTDINDHKTLENTLKLTMEAKSRFLSNMSHEIRTPLNGILGMVNFLLDTPLIPEALSYVNIIRNSTEGLRDLINDILLFSKVEANMLVLNHNWMDIRKVIEETNDLMFALAFDKGLELNYSIDQYVPPLIKGDQFRIRQILINLVGNAIKFTQTGEVFVSCSMDETAAGLEENERMIRFEVIDTGKGFTDEEANTLFTRFTQLGENKSAGGTGLGLAISMALVELHGGRMTTKGVPNRGAKFAFTLKCGVPTEEDGKIILEPKEQTNIVQGRPTVTTSSSQNSVSSSALAVSSPSSINELSTVTSSGSSDPNLQAATNAASLRSERSSMSSMLSDLHSKSEPLPLELPSRIKERSQTSSEDSVETVRPSVAVIPPTMMSILVISGLEHVLEAIVNQLESSIPKTTPHHITTRSNVEDCQELLVGPEAVTFTHLVIDVKDIPQIVGLLDLVLGSSSSNSSKPCIIIITDVKEMRELTEATASRYKLDTLKDSGKIKFIFKPLKASKIAAVIDPKRHNSAAEADMTSAQAVATVQRNAFNNLQHKYGDKGLKVLLLEDNRVNQQVLIRYLKRIHVDHEVVENGQEGLEKFMSYPPGHFILILCDLEMPVKDGYYTCKEIRKWEHETNQPHIPIIALSANVLGDVYSKCVDAGFSSYVTKPVDFQEMGNVLDKFLDRNNPAREEFLKMQ